MKRTHNPMLSLVALVLLVLILVLTCTGCTEAEAAETEPAPRFTIEHFGLNVTVITDNETGVQYMAYNGHGLCKLEG